MPGGIAFSASGDTSGSRRPRTLAECQPTGDDHTFGRWWPVGVRHGSAVAAVFRFVRVRHAWQPQRPSVFRANPEAANADTRDPAVFVSVEGIPDLGIGSVLQVGFRPAFLGFVNDGFRRDVPPLPFHPHLISVAAVRFCPPVAIVSDCVRPLPSSSSFARWVAASTPTICARRCSDRRPGEAVRTPGIGSATRSRSRSRSRPVGRSRTG